MSLRAAINAMCKSCIFDPRGGGGNWRQQVGACTAKNCPLWPHRPVSKPRPFRPYRSDNLSVENSQNGAGQGD
jgi:hypothetical protein